MALPISVLEFPRFDPRGSQADEVFSHLEENLGDQANPEETIYQRAYSGSFFSAWLPFWWFDIVCVCVCV